MLPYIIAGVLAVFALLGAVIAMQPKHFRVARSMRMGGPPEAAFDLVNDFREWTKWSPWEKYDRREPQRRTDSRQTRIPPAVQGEQRRCVYV